MTAADPVRQSFSQDAIVATLTDLLPRDLRGLSTAEWMVDELVDMGALVPSDRWDEECHRCLRRVGDHTVDGRCPAAVDAALVQALWEEWRINHDDRCTNNWPHPPRPVGDCYYPPPEALLGYDPPPEVVDPVSAG